MNTHENDRRSALASTVGGVMTEEVGAVTGDLELATRLDAEALYVSVRYAGSDEWYNVTGSPILLGAERSAPADLHERVVEHLTTPGAIVAGNEEPPRLLQGSPRPDSGSSKRGRNAVGPSSPLTAFAKAWRTFWLRLPPLPWLLQFLIPLSRATQLGESMLLEGSCHCKSVRFRVDSPSPYPYLFCYCSICRKTAGGGGYAINLGARAETLEVEGEENLSVYQARMWDHADGVEISPGQRSFCGRCGSALWVFDPRWPDLIHPFASAIDTPLPKPPEKVRMMLNYVAPWCEIPPNQNERHFPEFPDESLEAWHRRHGLYDEP